MSYYPFAQAMREITDVGSTVYDPAAHGDAVYAAGEWTTTLDASWAATDPGDGLWVAFPLIDDAGAAITGQKIVSLAVQLQTSAVAADDIAFYVCLSNDPDMDSATVDAALGGITYIATNTNPLTLCSTVKNDVYAGIVAGTADATMTGTLVQFLKGAGNSSGLTVAESQGLASGNGILSSRGCGINNTGSTSMVQLGIGALYLCIAMVRRNAANATPTSTTWTAHYQCRVTDAA